MPTCEKLKLFVHRNCILMLKLYLNVGRFKRQCVKSDKTIFGLHVIYILLIICRFAKLWTCYNRFDVDVNFGMNFEQVLTFSLFTK